MTRPAPRLKPNLNEEPRDRRRATSRPCKKSSTSRLPRSCCSVLPHPTLSPRRGLLRSPRRWKNWRQVLPAGSTDDRNPSPLFLLPGEKVRMRVGVTPTVAYCPFPTGKGCFSAFLAHFGAFLPPAVAGVAHLAPPVAHPVEMLAHLAGMLAHPVKMLARLAGPLARPVEKLAHLTGPVAQLAAGDGCLAA